MRPQAPPAAAVEEDVRRALAEDLGLEPTREPEQDTQQDTGQNRAQTPGGGDPIGHLTGDLTAELLPPGAVLHCRVVCREQAVFCGAPWFSATFARLDPAIDVEWSVADGDALSPGQSVCRVHGPAAPLLSGERTALNFIQTLSGTATVTHRYAAALAGTSTRLLDTRKTLPGLRQAQKYAVRCGGGTNHRMGLYDAVMLKENHLAAAGGIGPALAHARRRYPDVPLIVEVESLEELAEALAAGARRALLDNFSRADLRRAVALTAGRAELEASGDITLETIADVAATGVDWVSTGAITKHVRAVDFSLRFID